MVDHNGKMTVGRYLATRFSTLKPPMDHVVTPWVALSMLNKRQWNFFLCAWSAWILDALDFFTASLTITQLAKQFHQTNAQITWGITLVLMLRSVGSTLIGIWSDRFGRKWPFVANLVAFAVIELGTGFCETYSQFLACRALFGIAMGGIYGNAAATALEDVPEQARGLISGLFQAGYPIGYLLATVFSRALVYTTPHTWRSFFWFTAGLPLPIIAWRLCLPETDAYRQREGLVRASSFIKEGVVAVKSHWLTLCYLIVLMAGCNFMTHGAQDFYPTLLLSQFGFTPDQVTVTQVIANLGCATGAILGGYLSDIFGRRLTVMAFCVLAAALVYPYTYVTTQAVAASAFFLQLGVQGAFGVMPTHLMEMAPPVIRTFVVGTTYQLGNLASSPAAQLQAKIAEEYFPLPPTPAGVKRYDYAKVICALIAASVGLVVLVAFLGTEKKGRAFHPGSDLEDGPMDDVKHEIVSPSVHKENV